MKGFLKEFFQEMLFLVISLAVINTRLQQQLTQYINTCIEYKKIVHQYKLTGVHLLPEMEMLHPTVANTVSLIDSLICPKKAISIKASIEALNTIYGVVTPLQNQKGLLQSVNTRFDELLKENSNILLIQVIIDYFKYFVHYEEVQEYVTIHNDAFEAVERRVVDIPSSRWLPILSQLNEGNLNEQLQIVQRKQYYLNEVKKIFNEIDLLMTNNDKTKNTLLKALNDYLLVNDFTSMAQVLTEIDNGHFNALNKALKSAWEKIEDFKYIQTHKAKSNWWPW